MKKTVLCWVALVWGVLAPAQNLDSLSSLYEYYLNAVTITGTRTPKTLDNTPVVTRIITEEDIQKLDATTIKDVLLEEIPGVEFSYSMNQQVSLRMQGLGGMAVLFLIDGERLAGETLDNIDFQRLNMDNIERIEIVKGAASALYGSNSVGAVVNIITKNQTEPWTLRINSRLGSAYGEQRHGGTFGFRKGRFSNSLNIQNDSRHSYYVYDEADADSTLIFGTRQWNFKDKLVYQIAEGHRFIGRAGYYFHERNTSDYQKDRARDFSGGLRYVGSWNEDNALDISYTADRYDKSDYYPDFDLEFLDYKNQQHSLRGIYTHTFERNLSLTMGSDAMYDYLSTYQFAAGKSHDQYTADLFVQADWVIDTHWTLVAGLREDYFSRYGFEFSPKLAAMYRLGSLKLRSSYSKGFRAPTLKEMYMDFNMANVFTIYGNEDLQSERTNSFSLSAEYVRSYYSLTVTGFYNILDNEITTIWNPALSNGLGGMKYMNVEGTDLASLDLAFMARYPCGIHAKLGYSYFHEFTRNGNPNTADSRPHTLTTQIEYLKSWKNYQLNILLNGRFLSQVDYYTIASSSEGVYDTYKATTSPAYTLWKLSVHQKFYDAVTLTLGIDNIFDYRPKKYEYNSPYTIGRTYSIGASLEVEKLATHLKRKHQ